MQSSGIEDTDVAQSFRTPSVDADGARFVRTLIAVMLVQVGTLGLLWLLQAVYN